MTISIVNYHIQSASKSRGGRKAYHLVLKLGLHLNRSHVRDKFTGTSSFITDVVGGQNIVKNTWLVKLIGIWTGPNTDRVFGSKLFFISGGWYPSTPQYFQMCVWVGGKSQGLWDRGRGWNPGSRIRSMSIPFLDLWALACEQAIGGGQGVKLVC
jgi:hypothetical protein